MPSLAKACSKKLSRFHLVNAEEANRNIASQAAEVSRLRVECDKADEDLKGAASTGASAGSAMAISALALAPALICDLGSPL